MTCNFYYSMLWITSEFKLTGGDDKHTVSASFFNILE
jgi:hypothetical protein